MTDSQPPQSRRELTVRVVVLGLVLSVVMGAANVYVGLKVGMTVSASIPAAVVAMLVFRTFFKDSTILEANQVQTAASAGESLAAGIIFTMPALVLMGYWADFDFWTVTLVGFSGGLLGILFMIPMRKVFVVDNDELPYPEGVACAAVLEAGETQSGEDSGANALLMGGAIGALFKFVASFLAIFKETLEGAVLSGGRVFYYGSNISPMLVAVGLIVRLNVAVLIFIGGVIGWIVSMPLLGMPSDPNQTPVDLAWAIWSEKVRFIGVGAMVVGGAASIVAVRHGLVHAVRELRKGMSDVQSTDETARDLPSGVIITLGLVCAALIGYVYYGFTGAAGMTAVLVVVMIVMAFFFTAVASYIVGLVGNSNSPVSGMTITAVLFTGAVLAAFGYSGMEGMVAIIGVAAVVCCVACTAGDVCNDLKTGSMVGAAPFRQQIMQVLGVLVASLVMAPVLSLLHAGAKAKDGIGIGGPDLAAPQAGLFKSLAEGFAGGGELPWNLIGVGAAIGVVILIVDRTVLAARKSHFRMHLMPIAVGMYLPFGVATPILLGGLIAHFATREVTSRAEEDRILHKGILFSSGVIAGEALVGVGLAGLAVSGLTGAGIVLPSGVATGLTLVGAAGVLWLFTRMTKRS